MYIEMFLKWSKELFTAGQYAYQFLTTPIVIGGYAWSPIFLFSIGGLIAYIAVAVVLWILSSSPL